jgi:molybdate transport system substrate-binding protein
MKRRQILLFLSTTLTSLLLVLGLQLFNLAPAPSQQKTLLVSAAASLKDVLEEIRPMFQNANPGMKVTFNFGASGALLQQIEQGAPADVFISAANRQMDTLDQQGDLLPGTRSNLANNRLVLIAPKNNRTVTSFQSLTQPDVKRISVGEPRSVPAGQYAEQVLQKLKLMDQVKPKLVFANTVRQVLAAVESGNADAGMVYVTDAKISDQVRTIAIADANTHVPIVYPMAALKSSKNQEAAKTFLRFLSGNQAKSVLRKYGFIVPR